VEAAVTRRELVALLARELGLPSDGHTQILAAVRVRDGAHHRASRAADECEAVRRELEEWKRYALDLRRTLQSVDAVVGSSLRDAVPGEVPF
jgi:hypothetical protein